jgi:hypothetical protein
LIEGKSAFLAFLEGKIGGWVGRNHRFL